MTIETLRCAGGWYNRIRASNKKILMHSETYKRKRDAVAAVKLILKEAPWAKVSA